MRILIIGCGYVGSTLAQRLLTRRDTVFALTRGRRPLPSGVHPLLGDIGVPTSLSTLRRPFDALVYAVSPQDPSPAAYQLAYVEGLTNVLLAVGDVPRIIMTSTTGVYHQQDGSWVDEDSPTTPTDPASQAVLAGEQLLRQYPSVVLRLGGIYGPQRTGFIDQVRQGRAVRYRDVVHYGNRIHRDDAAAALEHLCYLPNPATCYLGVDSQPSDHNEVVTWLARQLGVNIPPEATFAEAAPARTQRSNKRCSNQRLRESGFSFQYPSFREGYRPLP